MIDHPYLNPQKMLEVQADNDLKTENKTSPGDMNADPDPPVPMDALSPGAIKPDETPPAATMARKSFLFSAATAKAIKRHIWPLVAKGIINAAAYAIPLSTIWNFGRHSPDPKGLERELREAGFGIALGTLTAVLSEVFNDIATNLGVYPEFKGDIGWMKETLKGLLGAITGAAGVVVSLILTDLSGEVMTARKWLILGWPVAFFFIQNSHDLLQLCFGKKMKIREADGSFGDAVKRSWTTFYKAFPNRNTWLRMAIPLTIVHYCHHHYAEQKPGYSWLTFAVFIFFSSAKLLCTIGNYVAHELNRLYPPRPRAGELHRLHPAGTRAEALEALAAAFAYAAAALRAAARETAVAY